MACRRSRVHDCSGKPGSRGSTSASPVSYVTPWDGTPQWEREAAGAVYEQVRQFVEVSGGRASRLSREQRGRFVAICWTAQMFKHFDDPKPGYVADWADLPVWQQETDADIFDAIEKALG